MRTRPIFKEWSIHAKFQYEDGQVNKHQVDTAVIKAGELVGLCDWRPRYGRFSVVKL